MLPIYNFNRDPRLAKTPKHFSNVISKPNLYYANSAGGGVENFNSTRS